MDDFFRFPHTPHIVWLGEGVPRDDKVLAHDEVVALLSGPVVVEEKLDGANLGFSVAPNGRLRAQNRGQYLDESPSGQFKRLREWMDAHGGGLAENLGCGLIAFGEWCAARHSLNYQLLPDWWMMFDVYDRREQRFWSSRRRNALAAKLQLATVPCLAAGDQSVDSLKYIVATRRSLYRDGALEGVIVRREDEEWLETRGKLVCPNFVQSIESHWRSRKLESNRIRWGAIQPDPVS